MIAPETHESGGPLRLSSPAQAQLIARSLADAARRARFSTRSRQSLVSGGFQARRGQRLWRALFIASFCLAVALPSLAAAVYYGFIASDQYATEIRFTLRGGSPPKLDALSALTGIPSAQVVQDTLIVTNYIRSRVLLETLDKTLDLRAMYSRPEIDWLSRLDPRKPVEKILKYWKSMADVNIEMPAGIVAVTVRAFTPRDSAAIAAALLQSSESLVNEMNERMQKDALALSLHEQARASDRLMQARLALEKARNEEGMLNAGRAADSINELLSGVRSELLKMQSQYASQTKFISKNAPQMQALQARINASSGQIAFLEAKLTHGTQESGTQESGKEQGGTQALSSAMTRLDYLELQRDVAEKIYESATVAVERARLTLESKFMYLNTFVAPAEAEEARYPLRLVNTASVIAASLAGWLALWGLLSMARNHMA